MASISSQPVQAWRLVKKSRVKTAFDGEGAFRFGGRWNNKRRHVVYASSSLSLALLEILVHIDPGRAVPALMAIPVEMPARLIERGPHSTLNRLGRDLPWSLKETRRIGDHWIAEARHTVLQIPSAIIPLESNYLLNPDHPDFRCIRIGKPEPLPVDTRL